MNSGRRRVDAQPECLLWPRRVKLVQAVTGAFVGCHQGTSRQRRRRPALEGHVRVLGPIGVLIRKYERQECRLLVGSEQVAAVWLLDFRDADEQADGRDPFIPSVGGFRPRSLSRPTWPPD